MGCPLHPLILLAGVLTNLSIKLTRGDTSGSITLPMPENGPIRIQPNKSALVIIDMQNFFLHESLNGDPKGRAVVRTSD